MGKGKGKKVQFNIEEPTNLEGRQEETSSNGESNSDLTLKSQAQSSSSAQSPRDESSTKVNSYIMEAEEKITLNDTERNKLLNEVSVDIVNKVPLKEKYLSKISILNKETRLEILKELLFYAIKEGNNEAVNFFIDCGAKLNSVRDIYNDTPLMLASYEGYSDIVKTLLVNGAIVKSFTKSEENKDINNGDNAFKLAIKGRLHYQGLTYEVERLDKYSSASSASDSVQFKESNRDYQGVFEILASYGSDIFPVDKTSYFSAFHKPKTEKSSNYSKIYIDDEAIKKCHDSFYKEIHDMVFQQKDSWVNRGRSLKFGEYDTIKLKKEDISIADNLTKANIKIVNGDFESRIGKKVVNYASKLINQSRSDREQSGLGKFFNGIYDKAQGVVQPVYGSEYLKEKEATFASLQRKIKKPSYSQTHAEQLQAQKARGEVGITK